jgi:hypothetical protein
MAVCVGFVRSQLSTGAWTRCVRPAMRRGRLCAEHRDGLDGALMGMLKFEEILPLKLEEMAREPKRKRRKRKKRSSSAWDTRNVAAATTTPERLEPDPTRACPAPKLKDENALKATEAEL